MQRVSGLLVLITFTSVTSAARCDDWPQWMGPQRDGVWRESGIADKFPEAGLPVRWRAPVGGGYSGPAVAEGRVFVTDRIPKSGAKNPSNQFARGQTPSIERVLCLNEADGKLLWKHEYDCEYTVSYPAGPRTTPAVADGKVYTLGAEGHLFCLDATNGQVVWSHDLKQEYRIPIAPVWGFSSNPLVDGDRLIVFVGGPGTTVVAFDRHTGQEIWRAIDSPASGHGPGYSSPVIFEAGGTRQLIAWHPDGVSSLDLETGKVYWTQPFKVREGLSLATPRRDGELLFVSAFYDGSMMLRLDAQQPLAKVIWQRKGRSERNTDALHCLINTPFVENGYVYGICSYGQLRGLNAANGDRIWESLQATGGQASDNDRWRTAFIVKQGSRFFLFNEMGELIIAELNPRGYKEIDRTPVLEPTNSAQRRDVVWTHPAFANRSIYARNDREVVCASLARQQ